MSNDKITLQEIAEIPSVLPEARNARRYANYRGGRKYAGADHYELERGTGDPEKAKSAAIFYELWKAAEADATYAAARAAWKKKYG